MTRYDVVRNALAAASMFAVMICLPAVAQASGELEEAEALLDRRFNGVVLAARDGDVIYARAFGLADQRTGAPNSTDMRFRMGSISKTFTATIVQDLAREGLLSLDDPLSNFFLGIPGAEQITVRHLLDHTSGLGDFSQDDWQRLLLSTIPLPRDEIISLIAGKRPKSSSGESFEYNNAGYTLLGFIIEDASGRAYTDVLREQLAALGLADTNFAARDGEIENLSVGHGRNRRPDETDYDYTAVASAGGLYTTANDLARWCLNHQGGADFTGWRSGERFGRAAYWHTGNTNDYSALLVRFPEVDGCYVVLSNVGRRAPQKEIMRTLPEHFFGSGE